MLFIFNENSGRVPYDTKIIMDGKELKTAYSLLGLKL